MDQDRVNLLLSYAETIVRFVDTASGTNADVAEKKFLAVCREIDSELYIKEVDQPCQTRL